MNPSVSREREEEVDLESGGGTTSGEDRTKNNDSANIKADKSFSMVLSRVLSFNRSSKGGRDINTCSNSPKFAEVADENVNANLRIDKNSEGEEGHECMALVKNAAEGKRKKSNTRKPPKPPLPPKGPSLDATDQKFVEEIAEIAMRRRARVERVRALKKMKAAKAPSWNSSLPAMIITLLFFLVIFLQGMCSRSSATLMTQGSPAPAVSGTEGFISVQFDNNFSAYDGAGTGSDPLNLVGE